MPEFQYVALPSSPLSSLFRWRSWDPTWPHAVGAYVQTIEIHRKIFKNLLLQNHLAQMLKIWYVALPSGPLPSFFK